jgi:hypothetical protein
MNTVVSMLARQEGRIDDRDSEKLEACFPLLCRILFVGPRPFPWIRVGCLNFGRLLSTGSTPR